MAPQAVSMPPPRLVDQNRHSAETGTLERWPTTTSNCGSPGNSISAARRRRWSGSIRWCRRYREAGRHYHGVRHLRWVVRHVNALSAHDRTTCRAVIAAAFFHDVVYDATQSDNETIQRRAGRSSADGTRLVAGATSARRRHDPGHDRPSTLGDDRLRDTQVLAGRRPGGARRRTHSVQRLRQGGATRVRPRQRSTSWRAGRSAVLHALLDRPHLFAPALELDDWEQRARANIAAELATLSG